MNPVQLAVVGGGPGGYAAAFLAADLGLSVALIDPEANPGGVCVYRGCIPSKALLHVAKLIGEARHASAWGITYGDPKIDLDKLRAIKEGVVAKLTGGLGQISKMRKVTYIRGRASFAGPTSLEIDLVDGGRETLTFGHAMIATGSRPTAVPGLSVESPAALLLRIATRLCLNRLRTRKRKPEDPDDALVQVIAESADSESRTLASLSLRRLFGDQETTQMMAVMFWVDGLTLEEVAQETGYSVSGVRKRLRQLQERVQQLPGGVA